MKCIVFERPDGSLAIFHPKQGKREDGESEDDFLARMTVHVKGKVEELRPLLYLFLECSELPQARDNRHSWRMKGKKCIEDSKVPRPISTKKQGIRDAKTIAELKEALLA